MRNTSRTRINGGGRTIVHVNMYHVVDDNDEHEQ